MNNQASSAPTLSSLNQKLVLTSENWAMVDACEHSKSAFNVGFKWKLRADVLPPNIQLNPCAAVSGTSSLGVSYANRQPRKPLIKRPIPQTVMFGSGLNVRVDPESPEYEYFCRLSEESPSGYLERNSVQALKRFVNRGVIQVIQSTIHQCAKKQSIAEIVISVPVLNVGAAKFSGTGSSDMVAEQKCAMKVLASLYANNVIKEANVEFHRQRKAIMDSSKDLDLKLRGYLNSSPWTFSQILSKIAAHEEYFDRRTT